MSRERDPRIDTPGHMERLEAAAEVLASQRHPECIPLADATPAYRAELLDRAEEILMAADRVTYTPSEAVQLAATYLGNTNNWLSDVDAVYAIDTLQDYADQLRY